MVACRVNHVTALSCNLLSLLNVADWLWPWFWKAVGFVCGCSFIVLESGKRPSNARSGSSRQTTKLWLLSVEVPGWLRSGLTFFFWTECELAGHEDSPSSKRKSYSKNFLIYQGKNAVFISKSSEAWPGQTVQNILNLILKFLVHVLISRTIVFLTEVFKFASPSVNVAYSTAMAIIQADSEGRLGARPSPIADKCPFSSFWIMWNRPWLWLTFLGWNVRGQFVSVTVIVKNL